MLKAMKQFLHYLLGLANDDNRMTFAELIRDQEELLRQLLLASQRQLEIVELCDTKMLLDHLRERECLWHKFELLVQHLAPYKDISWERRGWKSAKECQQTKVSLNRCQALLEEIMANDKISFARASERMDDLKKDLENLRRKLRK